MAKSTDPTKQAFANFRNEMIQGFKDLPAVIGVTAVNFAIDNFQKQGYGGKSWQPRKAKKSRRKTKPILQQAGHLKNSFRVLRSSATVVVVGSAMPYAQIHNQGGMIQRSPKSETFVRNRYAKGKRKGKFKKGTVSGRGLTFKAYTITMPKRTFFMDDEVFKPVKN